MDFIITAAGTVIALVKGCFASIIAAWWFLIPMAMFIMTLGISFAFSLIRSRKGRKR